MGKKGGKPKPPGRTPTAPTAKPNLFEQLYTRKKFDVLGRKRKGVGKKSSVSRNDAVEKRKKTLLVEYKQLKKANAFVDRRFGEDDDNLTPEKKAILRFQKQRMKEAAGSKFALGDGDDEEEDQLTHFGRSLADYEGLPGLQRSDDEGEALDDETVRNFHFGGGFVRKPPTEGAAEEDGQIEARHRSKKEVMEEVIMKSKQFKAERQQQREEDLAETEQLDEQFNALLSGAALGRLMRPAGAKIDAKSIPQDEGSIKFDVMRRELVFETRGQASERSLTPEELALQERARLERLEKQRQKRMRGTGDESDAEVEELDLPAGGYAARRAKQRRLERDPPKALKGASGDALEDDFQVGDEDEGSSEDDEGEEEEDEGEGLAARSALEKRQQARAATDHPLNQSLRKASAALALKYGVAPSGKSAQELAGSGEASSQAEDDSEEIDESGAEQSHEDEDQQQNVVGSHVEATSVSEDGDAASGSSSGKEVDEASSADDDGSGHPAEGSTAAAAGDAAVQERGRSAGDGGVASTSGRQRADLQGPLDLPFTLPAPGSYQEFAALVSGRSPADLAAVIHRILGSNATALATENRRKMQIFYGILVQHFATLAGASPLSLPHLDALTVALLQLTPDVPFYAATVARARLQRIQDRLTAAAKSPGPENDWGCPQPRVLLLCKLWATLFPASDRRHPVMTPVALVLGGILSRCPLATPRHAALALLAAGLSVHMAAPAKRLVPEALTLAVRLLAGAATPYQSPGESLPWLQLRDPDACSSTAAVPPLQLAAVLGAAPNAALFDSDSFRLGLIATAVRLAGRCGDVFGGVAALPELLAPAVAALHALASAPGLPQELQTARQEVVEQLEQQSAAVQGSRRPLVRRSSKAAEVRQFNPRFEEGYVAGKDYDPDRERAEAKKLRRAVNQERRGAMRELRKDSVFLGAERDRDKAAAKAERRAQGRRNLAFMEKQESDFKSGGQGGMWRKKKGLKGIRR